MMNQNLNLISSPAVRKLRFLLELHEDGEVLIKSVEVPQRGKSRSTRWLSGERIFTALNSQVSTLLTSLMMKLTHHTSIISMPDYRFKSDSIQLKGATISSKMRADGMQVISIDFRQFVGPLSSIIRDGDDLNTQVDQIVDHVMLDLVTPIANLAGMREYGAFTTPAQAQEILNALLNRADEIAFQADLIKRRTRYKAEQADLHKVPQRVQLGAPTN